MKALLYFLLTFILFWLLLGEPIAQDHHYHHFADRQEIFGIPNFWNVISNLPFILIGTWGFFKMKNKKSSKEKRAILILCIGVLLTGLGSAYYHWNPENFTLIWDRIPMTIVFSSFFILLLYHKYNDENIFKWFWPLIGLSAATVLYWYTSEEKGEGDLRPYAIVQFLPMVITVYFLFDKEFFKQNRFIIWALLFYVLAKAFEHFDVNIDEYFVIGGHPLKHLAASISCWYLVKGHFPASK